MRRETPLGLPARVRWVRMLLKFLPRSFLYSPLLLSFFKSALYCTCCHAAVYLLLEDQEQHEDRNDRDQHACTDVVVLVSVRARKFIEGGGNGLQILVLQIQVGHVVLVVNTHTFQYQRSHDGHGAGQTNFLVLVGQTVHDYEISTGSHGTVGDNVRRLEGA